MRKGWTETTLGEIADIQMGQSPDGSTYNNESVGLPFMQGSAEFGEHYPKPNKWCSEPKKIAEIGDLLLSVRAPVGDTNFADQRIAVGRGLSIIRAKSSLSDTNFIRMFIQLNLSEMISNSGSGMFSSITGHNLRNFSVFLPPLPEQKRIVDLISSVDSYIDALEKQAECARKSRSAVLEELLATTYSYPKKTLKQLTSKIGSGATPRGGEDVYIKNGISLIRSQNVHDSRFLFQGLVSIDENAANALENASVEERDVLINITGASVTRCCVVDSSVLPARVNQHVAILRANQTILLPEYLVIAITSEKIKSFLNDIAGSGSTRQALTKNHLETLALHIPPIKRQYQIVDVISAMDLIIAASEKSVSETKQLRSGLLSDLLSRDHAIPESYDKVIGATR